MKKEFHHIGIPTKARQPNEIHLAPSKLFITDAMQSEHRVEWLRFEPGCPMPELLQTVAHVAYSVDNLDEALAGRKVIVQPFFPMEGVRGGVHRRRGRSGRVPRIQEVDGPATKEAIWQ